jgi:NAD(P) transhydrogenase subunit alpha
VRRSEKVFSSMMGRLEAGELREFLRTTNAISSVIIVGALLAAGASAVGFSQAMGFLAIVLASVNIVGGFAVTQRMLSKFKKKQK